MIAGVFILIFGIGYLAVKTSKHKEPTKQKSLPPKPAPIIPQRRPVIMPPVMARSPQLEYRMRETIMAREIKKGIDRERLFDSFQGTAKIIENEAKRKKTSCLFLSLERPFSKSCRITKINPNKTAPANKTLNK